MPPVKRIIEYLDSRGNAPALPLREMDSSGHEWICREADRLQALCHAEEQMTDSPGLLVAGVDEAGRGPLAGPVTASAVVFKIPLFLPGMGDSKQVPDILRRRLADIITGIALASSVVMIPPEEIDRQNILNASLCAMGRAVESLRVQPQLVLVDGNRKIPGLSIPQRTVVKGDSRIYCIAGASLVAKTARDRHMEEMEKAYPGYGFARHKGYGTREHMKALEKLGPCPIHRRSFSPVACFFQEPGNSHCCEVRPGREVRAKSLGRRGEEVAGEYLQKRGLKILEQNFRTREGEIDIIAREAETVIFIEVKTRAGSSHGGGIESIDTAKQVQLRRMALVYLAREGIVESQVRFDVMTIEKKQKRWQARWIKGAF